MKRLFSLMMAVMVLCTCFSIPVAAAGEAVITEIEFGSLDIAPEFDSGVTEYKVYMEDGEIPDPKYKISDGDSAVITTKAQKMGETTVITVTSPSGDTENVYKFTFVGKRLEETPVKSWDPVVMSNQVLYADDTHYTKNYSPTAYLNLCGKNNGMYTTSNTWAFIRISLKDIPERADKLKIHLISIASFKTDLKAYEWTIGIYDAPGVKADWTFAEKPSQMAANGNKTSLLGDRISEINQDSVEIDGSKYIVGGDLTEYLLKKKAEGVAETTICLAMETTNHTAQMRAVFTPYQSTTAANRPYLSWVTYPADRNNKLKSISFENGAIAEKISAGKTEYKVAKFETGELKAKYITASPFATVEETTDADGNIILKVVAESGEENVYTFNPVSAEEAGFKANGKIEIEKDADGNEMFEIAVDENVKSTVEIKNAAQTKKTFFLVTNAVKDGKLVGRTAEKITVDPGYYTVEAKTDVPADKDGLKVISYIAEDDEFTPVSKLTTYGDAEEFEKKEELSVKFANVAEDVLTVSGKDEDAKIANIFVIKEGKDFDDYNGENFDEVFLYANVMECEDGYYGFSVNLDGASEEDYTILVNGEEVEFTFENKASREDMFSDMLLSGDLKTALDITNPESDIAKYFLLDTSFTEYASEDEFIEILNGFVLDESITEEDLDIFDEIYKDTVKIIELNYGKAENLDDYNKVDFNEDVKKYYDLMDDEDKIAVLQDGMSGNNFKKFEEINPVFEEATMVTFISEYDNNDKVVELIEEFADDLGLDSYIGDFKSLNSIKKNAVIDAVKEKAPFGEVSELEESFKKAVKANMPKKESQGGGGGGATGGGTGIKQEITTTKDTEVKDIPADNFVPARAYKFADMTDYSWAEEAVKALYESYVIDGASETEFNPAGQVKREEFVKMINPLYEGSEVTAQFADMDMTLWYVPFINKAVGAGVIKGIDEKTFGIGHGVTRQDMAVIVYRVLKGEKTEAEAFADDSDIADYAKDAVYFLKSKGIISGTGEGNFEPSRVMTRAEAAVVVNNIIKLGK